MILKLHLTTFLRSLVSYSKRPHLIWPGNICQKIFQWQVACILQSHAPFSSWPGWQKDQGWWLQFLSGFNILCWPALLSHSTDNLQLEQFATPDQICLWHGRFQSWSEKPFCLKIWNCVPYCRLLCLLTSMGSSALIIFASLHKAPATPPLLHCTCK